MSVDDSAIDLIEGKVLPWQQQTVKHLVELNQQRRLPHAILIEIATQVDSRNFGWYLVTALLCKNPGDEHRPCGACQHCRLMHANNYPDFTFTTVIENEKTHKLNKDIKIDQVRRLIHQLSLTPNLQAGKLALVYPAEKMNTSSANSLLKTLEEPADQSTLILLTHNAGKLPITIRSRCQFIKLNNPPMDMAQSWLTQQGFEAQVIQEYLQLTHQDAELALNLSKQNFIENLKQAQAHFQDYLDNQLDVVGLYNQLKNLEPSILRLIIKNVLIGSIQACLERPLEASKKQQLKHLIDLTKHSNFVLQTEENNLNFQLQLEDVLISFKQIQNRGNDNASTEPGYLVT